MEAVFSSEKGHAVKIAHRIVAGIKNLKTAEWFSVHLVTDQDGVFGLNGDTVTGNLLIHFISIRNIFLEHVVWDSSCDIFPVMLVNVKKKIQRLTPHNVSLAMLTNGVMDGQIGANGAVVQPNVVVEPVIESAHVMVPHQVD